MAQYYKKVSVRKRVLTVIVCVIVAAAVLFTAMFFGFRKYIVETDDGIRLEIPWLDYNT